MGADYTPVSQVEQGDAADAPPSQPVTPQDSLAETLTEVQLQIKRSSMWVYYMLAVQVVSFNFNTLISVN
jgi:hypothetical protein